MDRFIARLWSSICMTNSYLKSNMDRFIEDDTKRKKAWFYV